MLKRIVINVFLVVIVVFILDFSIGKVLSHYYFKAVAGENYDIIYGMEKTHADVLVFGSSRANHHYVPKVFKDSLDLDCYNTGKDGSPLLYQNAILKSVLKRYTPKVIILEYLGGKQELENAYDQLSYLTPFYDRHEEIRDIVELKGPFEKVKLLSEAYAFNSEIYYTFRNTVYKEKRKTDNGYKPELGFWQQKIDTVNSFQPYDKMDIAIEESLKDFLSLAKISGSNIVVVCSPMYLYYTHNQGIDYMKQLCNEKKIPFWDYSNDTLFLNNRKYFHDPMHLNHNGAILFSNILAGRIKKEIKLN